MCHDPRALHTNVRNPEVNPSSAANVMAYESGIEEGDVNGTVARRETHEGDAEPTSARPVGRAAWVALVTSTAGLVAGAIAGALAPDSARTPVVLVVAVLTAGLLGWNLDRLAAWAPSRVGPRVRA